MLSSVILAGFKCFDESLEPFLLLRTELQELQAKPYSAHPPDLGYLDPQRDVLLGELEVEGQKRMGGNHLFARHGAAFF